jgi:hypothetical protein
MTSTLLIGACLPLGIVSAADPLNLVGIIVPGERVPANSGNVVAFRDGVAVAPVEQELGRANVLAMPMAR